MTWPPGSAGGAGPLSGVRVVDLSRILAGPFATTILADLGADVIKIEHPKGGDETRRWGPPFAPSGSAAYFYACNRGKRSFALDLRDDDDRRAVLALITEADVLVENFLPGSLDRLGLDRATLRAMNPRLVHCTISGFGHDSSRSRWPGFDFLIQAHAGIMSVTGFSPDAPVKAGVPIADLGTGLFSTIGILAALRRASETGEGSHIEVALADACGALLVNQAMNYLIGGITPGPGGNTHPSIAPYQLIKAQDRRFAVGAGNDPQFAALCRVAGCEPLIDDPRFATNADRVANRGELEHQLENAFATGKAAGWVRALNEAGVGAAVVNTVADMLEDPDTRARLVVEVADGDTTVGQLRTPIWINGRPLEPGAAPPALGAHNDALRALRIEEPA